MSASILYACGLNEQKLPPLVHISEESNVDSSFLISSILGQRLRISNAGTLLVCLQHNYQHYFNAGMRLGYNANIFLSKTLSVIDPLTEMARDFFGSRWLADERQVASLLLAAIREELTTHFKNRDSVTILIDNLSILRNLGASSDDVLRLYNELAQLPQEIQNLSVITKLNNCDVYPTIDKNISKRGDLRINVVKLKSGVFKEVDGKIVIERDAPPVNGETSDTGYLDEVVTKELLYKVNDRNVKIFGLGEIGTKA